MDPLACAGKKKDPAAHKNRIQMNPDEKQTEPKGSTTMFACNPGIGKNFWAGDVIASYDYITRSHMLVAYHFKPYMARRFSHGPVFFHGAVNMLKLGLVTEP